MSYSKGFFPKVIKTHVCVVNGNKSSRDIDNVGHLRQQCERYKCKPDEYWITKSPHKHQLSKRAFEAVP